MLQHSSSKTKKTPWNSASFLIKKKRICNTQYFFFSFYSVAIWRFFTPTKSLLYTHVLIDNQIEYETSCIWIDNAIQFLECIMNAHLKKNWEWLPKVEGLIYSFARQRIYKFEDSFLPSMKERIQIYGLR